LRDEFHNHLNVWLSIFPCKGAGESHTCDELLIDFFYAEFMLWDVIKACYQNDASRAQILEY
jgi:hypothetical protein